MAFRTTTHDCTERIEARGAKYAGTIKRTRWLGGELIDLVSELVDAITTRVVEASVWRDAERATKREANAIRMEGPRGSRPTTSTRSLGPPSTLTSNGSATGTAPPRSTATSPAWWSATMAGLGHRDRQGRPTSGAMARHALRAEPPDSPSGDERGSAHRHAEPGSSRFRPPQIGQTHTRGFP
jgi:hypothetical protein